MQHPCTAGICVEIIVKYLRRYVIPASLMNLTHITQHNVIKMKTSVIYSTFSQCSNRQPGQAMRLQRNVSFNYVGVVVFEPRASAWVQCVGVVM